MKDPNEVAVLIQARLSSQRCPRKMIRQFADTTLMDLCIQKLVDSKIPNNNIWISVHEPELVELAKKYPVNLFHRSEKSAMSEGTPLTEIYEWWDKLPLNFFLGPNSPSVTLFTPSPKAISSSLTPFTSFIRPCGSTEAK